MLLNPLQSRKLLDFALSERFAVLAVNADSPAAVYDCISAAAEVITRGAFLFSSAEST